MTWSFQRLSFLKLSLRFPASKTPQGGLTTPTPHSVYMGPIRSVRGLWDEETMRKGGHVQRTTLGFTSTPRVLLQRFYLLPSELPMHPFIWSLVIITLSRNYSDRYWQKFEFTLVQVNILPFFGEEYYYPAVLRVTLDSMQRTIYGLPGFNHYHGLQLHIRQVL